MTTTLVKGCNGKISERLLEGLGKGAGKGERERETWHTIKDTNGLLCYINLWDPFLSLVALKKKRLMLIILTTILRAMFIIPLRVCIERVAALPVI